MNKKKILIIVMIILLIILGLFLYQYIRIKTAKIEVELKDNLKLEFNDQKHVSDYIESINGKIVDDYIIDSSEIGIKDINFEFINDDNIKVKYSYQVEVVDTIKPLIWLGNSYNIKVGSEDDLIDLILCGDNYDNKPNCYIEGDYDTNTVGEYELVFNAIDSSGNKESQNFTLNVFEPVEIKNNITEVKYTDFNEIKNEYKNNNTKIGIDVSSWQCEIDFEKLKNAGVEFVIIRVGYNDIDGYTLDKNFKRNIEEANKYGIDTGIYFYSYASSIKEAKKDAKWVLKQIKKYDVKMPIVFDWEEWKNFNSYNLSFFGLTSMAEAFLDEIESAGYKAMLYSSKSYLDNIWMNPKYDIWVAHYNRNVSYDGIYKMWQICDNGKVDGISKAVDIDIMYE